VALVVGLGGLPGFCAVVTGAGAMTWVRITIKLGTFGCLLPVYFTVAHRMFPFFATNVVAGYVPWRPMTLLGAGLLIALVSGLPAVVRGQPFLTAIWAPGPLPLGTPALFDIGVFLVVAGVVLMMIFSLAEES
jgi:uncharacterized protein involved in response to NO